MNRLFVDVDDTLILWDDNSHRPNLELIQALSRVDLLKTIVFVWSGGGANYANEMRRRYLPWADHSIMKDIKLPSDGDICIDDQKIVVRGELLTWQEYVMRVD